MAIISKPIRVRDITALSSPGCPVSVETTKATKDDDVLAHGWLTEALVQPGIVAFAARYDSHEAYTIGMTANPLFRVSLYLGDGYRSEYGGRDERFPSGHYSVELFDEPTPQRLHRGESRLQKRCEILLRSSWINSGAVEQWDDTGLLRKTLSRTRIRESAAASPRMISAASTLFEAASWDGPLAGLRREAATLSFLTEALTEFDARQIRLPTPAIVRKMMRVREQLDSLAPNAEVRLAELAAQHDMSVRSLSRNFKLTFDATILAYVAHRRMDLARIALEHDELTIDQAAYIAGFAFTSNFSAAFKQRFGYPPRVASARNRVRLFSERTNGAGGHTPGSGQN